MDLSECRALIDHAEWADATVWKAVAALDGRHADIEAKLHHVHTVQWAYLQIWRGEEVHLPELETFGSPDDIREWARGCYRDVAVHLDAVSEADLRRDIHFPWADGLVRRFGTARPAAWAETVLQVAMHSSYHRGQVAQRLRELGAEPPLTDFIAWIWMGRPRADWDQADDASPRT